PRLRSRFGDRLGFCLAPPAASFCQSILTEPHDELAPPHSMTSSARSSNDSGMVRPSAFAVVRVTTKSYLVGSAAGRWPGFAPSRIVHVVGRAPKRGQEVWSIGPSGLQLRHIRGWGSSLASAPRALEC